MRVKLCPSDSTVRPKPLTIPSVTVQAKACASKGFPIATKRSPTSKASLSPIVAAVKLSASIFKTAKSVDSSPPINCASKLRPSYRVTVSL